MLVSMLKSHAFFAGVSEQTLYLLAFELIKVRKFKPNEVILSQSKRSRMNYCYREFFENKMEAVQHDIIHQRNRLREQCEQENTSMFSAMLDTIRLRRENLGKPLPADHGPPTIARVQKT